MNISHRLSILAVAAVFSFSAMSCTDKKYTTYQCPMKCEKEKTYDKPGKCPVCDMKLKGIS